MTDKIMLQAKQISNIYYNSRLARNLKEMVEAVIYERTVPDPSPFLNFVSDDCLKRMAESEKKAIIAQIDLSELKNDTFTLVTRYLKNKGHLKKKKKRKGLARFDYRYDKQIVNLEIDMLPLSIVALAF